MTGEEEPERSGPLVFVKLPHFPGKAQKATTGALESLDRMAWSLDDLKPSAFHALHEVCLENKTLIFSRLRRLLSRHETFVREDVEKMLSARIFITI